MKKIITFLLTAVLCMGMSVSVFAANSPTVDNSNKLPTGSATVDGQPATVEVKTIAAAYSSLSSDQQTAISAVTDVVNAGNASAITAMQKNLIKEVANVEAAEIGYSKLVDVTIQASSGISSGVQITFSDAGIRAGMNIVMLHLKADGTWENIPVQVANGQIIGTFTSFSPVYYMEVKNTEYSAPASKYEPADITFTRKDGKAMRWISSEQDGNISISGLQTVIVDGASFSAEEVKSSAITNAVVKAKGDVPFVAYDFSLTANGNELTTFAEHVDVSMPVPGAFDIAEGQTVTVYYYNNGRLEKCNTVVADGFVTFGTTHFSTYVYVLESKSSAAATPVTTGLVSPKTSENNMVMYVSLLAVVAFAGAVYGAKKRTGRNF